MSLDRREFVKLSTAATASLAGGLPVLGQQPPTALIPADKGYSRRQLDALRDRGDRRIYTGDARYTIGMPIGGICAGQLYLLGDGTLGGWHIDGRLNPTGYGAHNYRTFQPPRELKQGLAITTGERTFTLSDRDCDCEFIGEYPIAQVRYKVRPDAARGAAPAISATLHACSPFIPLNAKDSALPCTILRYTLTNDGDAPIRGSLTGYLENGVQRDAVGAVGAPHFKNEVHRTDSLTSVLMSAIEAPRSGAAPRPERRLADFNGPDYAGWTAEGAAFGEGPAKGTLENQNPVSGFEGQGLVNTFLGGDEPTGKLTSTPFTIDRTYLVFLIGGGGHKNQTCMNLLIDGKAVRTQTGKNNERLELAIWDLAEFQGKDAQLEIVDAASGPWGHINIDRISLADEVPDEFRRPKDTDLTHGTMALSYLGAGGASPSWRSPLIGNEAARPQDDPTPIASPTLEVDAVPPVAAISAPFELAPGQSDEFVFIVSWHFPNIHTGHRQMYTNWFDDALAVAAYVAEHDARLWEQTRLLHKTYYQDTTLPWWLATRLLMPLSNMATGTAQWWDDGRFWGWEGVGCCHGTCTHVWNYAHAHARFFPELARSARVMQDLGTAFEEETGRVAFRGEVDRGFAYAADGQCGTVLKCYREHLTSPDDSFLRANWPRIRKALEYSIAKDAEQSPDGVADGVIETRQHNTFDIDFVGPNTFVGSLYIAALLAGMKMATLMDDDEAAKRYLDLHMSGRRWTEEHLYNGEYFRQIIPEDQPDRFQYGTGCLSDQLFGQTWARLLDLPPVYARDKIENALRCVYRYNFTPAVAAYSAEYPPERVFAQDRDAGLFICTWPRGGRPDEPVRYKDEVWTGIEYQVAAGLAFEGLVDEALAICKAVDDRYDGRRHNPWNEVECGDHYARAMASWGVYQALMGYVYDGPAGILGMSPKFAPDDFAGFFLGAEGWGVMHQQRTPEAQTITIDVRWGRLRFSQFVCDLPRLSRACLLTTPGAAEPRRAFARTMGRTFTRTLFGGSPDDPESGWVTLTAGQQAELRWLV